VIVGFIALGVAVLIVIGVVVVHEREAPDAFPPFGNVVGATVDVGTTYSFGMGAPVRGADIEHVDVAFRPGSARATTTVSICHRGSIGTGHGWTELRSMCEDVVPADGGHVEGWTPNSHRKPDYLVLTVVPLEPGEVRIGGIEVRHRHDGRAKTEHTGPTVEIHVVESSS
jgi:hypothetical protein